MDMLTDREPFMRPFTQCVSALSCALAFGLQAPLAAGATDSVGDFRHMGVASCASSVCHGKIKPQQDRDVALRLLEQY